MKRPAQLSVAIEARRVGSVWRLRAAPLGADTESDITEADRAEAARSVTPRLTAMRERLLAGPEPWLQELLLEGYLDRMTALFVAERFAEAALADPARVHRVAGPAVEVCAEMIATALHRAGAAARVSPTVCARRWVHHIITGALGLAAFLLLVARTARWPSSLVPNRRRIAALHAEAANRTNHLLRALATLDPADSAVLLVGRPQIGLGEAQLLLRDYGWDGPIAFALDPPAALLSLPRALVLLAGAPRALARAGLTLGSRDQVAACFRVLLGAASAAWVRRQSLAPGSSLVFGHSGRADTTSLERAVQERGGQTIHWMHGLSVGHGFAGVSDLCVFQCQQDARWHERLGGYRRTMAFPAPRPAFDPGPADDKRWLVLTNFTHYGYNFFQSIGPAHEFRLIEILEEIASRQGLAPGCVTWKPHPVFWQRDPDIRAAVCERLERAGFQLWPAGDRDFARALGFGTVVSTPSGVAVDMLKMGRLPVMAQFHAVDPEHALARFELRGGDAPSLIAAAERARDPALARPIFERVWDAIGPARTPSFDEIVAEAARAG